MKKLLDWKMYLNGVVLLKHFQFYFRQMDLD